MIREFTEEERGASLARSAANKPWTFYKSSEKKPSAQGEGNASD